MVKSNYHTHTLFSDGIDSAEEIAKKAIEKNFLAIGYSDHSYTWFDSDYCMKKNGINDYISKISELKKCYKGKIDVLCGIELDYYSDETDASVFDYVIGSVHYVRKDGIYYPVDNSRDEQIKCINEGFGGDSSMYAAAYYENLCSHLNTNSFDIVGHFDLLTIFGAVDEENPKYIKSALETADYIAERGTVMEVNTGPVFKKRKKHPYPSYFILKYFLEKGGQVMINSDSHNAESLDFYFEETCVLLKEIGYKSAVRLRKDGWETYAI